jgi:hypothetical protein
LFPDLVDALISIVIPLFVAFSLGVLLAAAPLFVVGIGCVVDLIRVKALLPLLKALRGNHLCSRYLWI